MNKKQKAFTIIELLLALAVITFLVSIVAISFKGVREKARIAKTLQFSQGIQNALGADIVLNLSFDDQANPTKDASGYGNDGTINGAVFTPDTPHKVLGAGPAQGKYALYFDGNDYVDCGNKPSLNITDAITIEAWVKLNALNHQYVVGKTNSGCTENGYGIALDPNGKFEIIIWGGAGGAIRAAPGGTLAQTGVWYHVVGTTNGTNVYLYLNGNLDRSASGGMPGTIGGSPLFIGKVGCGYPTNGLIDEVHIYNRALTAMEIQKHYAEGIARHQLVQK